MCVVGYLDIGLLILFFFFNDTPTTEIYTLSLHDALPISPPRCCMDPHSPGLGSSVPIRRDRKSTRLNSSHVEISYAVFCLKKKKTIPISRMIPMNAISESSALKICRAKRAPRHAEVFFF